MKELFGLVPLVPVICSGQAFAQRYAIFPRFASDGGWTSELILANQGISTVSGISVAFYDQDGAKLPAQSNLGSGATYTFSLNRGATKNIAINSGSSSCRGMLW